MIAVAVRWALLTRALQGLGALLALVCVVPGPQAHGSGGGAVARCHRGQSSRP